MTAVVTSLRRLFFLIAEGPFPVGGVKTGCHFIHLPFVCGGGRACQVVIKPDSANWLRVGTPFV